MNEAELTETLDSEGLLEVSYGPGVYALELKFDSYAIKTLQRKWYEHFEIAPSTDFLGQLSHVDRLIYVGASNWMYDRLCDHVNGEKRKTAIMQVFPPADLFDIRPCESPYDREYGIALDVAKINGARVWCNGELL